MLHTVSQGDTIRAEDINQFVEVYQEHPTDNIFGTHRGVLIQSDNTVHNSHFKNYNFKQVQEVVDSNGSKVAVALGEDYTQALKLLAVDGIYSVMSDDAIQLSDWNWYGYTEQMEIDKTKMKPSGLALTQISDWNDYIYGYSMNADIDGDNRSVYVFSSLDQDNTVKELSNIGFEDITVNDSRILATKTEYNVQNIFSTEKQKDIIKQFTLRGLVETRKISSDEGDKKQYKWKLQWYSEYDSNTEGDTYGVKFNNKKLRFKGENEFDTPDEGWNDLSASEDWEDEIALSTDVYLNVMVDLQNGYQQTVESPVQWKYNENRTWYDVDTKPLSVQFWCIPGSQVPGSYSEESEDYDYSDGYWVATSFKLGEIYINNDYTKVDQYFDGTQTFVAPFYTNLSSEGLSSFDVPDSEISDVNLSSLYRKNITLTSMVSSEVEGHIVWDEISTTYSVWRFWDFDEPEIQTFDNLSLSSEGDDNTRSFVIREETPDKKAIVRYAVLSDVITDISGDVDYGEIGLSSIMRKNISKTKSYVELYNFDNPDSDFTLGFNKDRHHLESKYKVLVRDDEKKTLRYADLSIDVSDLCNAISAISSDISSIRNDIQVISSEISAISADMKTDSEVPSIELSSVQRYSYVDENNQRRRAYMLYHFDKPDNDLVLRHKDLLNDKWKVLVRDGDQKTLRYAEISSYSADSQSTNEQFNSVEIDEDNDIIGLYNFRKDEGHSLEIAVPSLDDYYFQGLDRMEPKDSDENNMDIVVRNKNSGQHTIDYRSLSIEIPPFVHGDADDFIGPTHWSIDSVPNTVMPQVSYYQLHNFGYPNPTTVNNDLVSSDYYNLANGKKKGSDDEDEDLFLIRNEAGELVYRKLYAKAEGGGGQTIIERIEHVEERVVVICSDVSAVSADLYELSSNLSSKLSDDFWLQGGDVDTCYGSSIGNSSKSGVIGLDAQALYGNWTADADFKVNGDITCDNDIFGFSIKGDYGSFDTIRSYNGGDITVDNNIDMSNHELNNVSKIGDLNLADKELEGDWKTTGEHTVNSCINCDWLFKGDLSHNDGVNVGGLQLYGKWSTNDDFKVNGTLTIGNTTLTETQLQQLLALIGN